MSNRIRGVSDKHEVRFADRARDTRTASKIVIDWASEAENASLVLVVFSMLSFIMPVVFELSLMLALPYAYWVYKKRRYASQPLKVPKHSNRLDTYEIDPKTRQPSLAMGVHYLGNEIDTDLELWLTEDDMRRHNLVLGTTGSGKTENLKGYVANALSMGSGCLFVDGKADTDLWANISKIARRFARDDDLLAINFLKTEDPSGINISNTLNPLSYGSADTIRELLVSLMSNAGGDNAMWKDRAIALISCLVSALAYLRDHHGQLLDVDVLRSYFPLEKVQRLEQDETLPAHIRRQITTYLESLAGYEPSKPAQETSTLEQHAFLVMQFTRLFASLADTYGEIFANQYPDIDLKDVVINRRIVCVLLPALMVSEDELANLGKVIVANLKNMMGGALGSAIEGDVKDIIYTKPTNAPTPFYVFFDEVGTYTVSGMAVMSAQARSLGFCLVFGTQDKAGMTKRERTEAEVIIGNTSLKVGMKIEDPGETAELVIKSAGKVHVDQTRGFERKGSSIMGYSDQNVADTHEKDRITLLDLKAQNAGEAHFIWSDRLIRARTFYVGLPDLPRLRVVRGLYLPSALSLVNESTEQDEARLLENHKSVARALVRPRILGQLDDSETFKQIGHTLDVARALPKSSENDSLAAALLFVTKDLRNVSLAGGTAGAGTSGSSTLSILAGIDGSMPTTIDGEDEDAGIDDDLADAITAAPADVLSVKARAKVSSLTKGPKTKGASKAKSDTKASSDTRKHDDSAETDQNIVPATSVSDDLLDGVLSKLTSDLGAAPVAAGSESGSEGDATDDDFAAAQLDFKQALASAQNSPCVQASDDELFADVHAHQEGGRTSPLPSASSSSLSSATSLDIFAADSEEIDWDAPDSDDGREADARFQTAVELITETAADDEATGDGEDIFGMHPEAGSPEIEGDDEMAREGLISREYLSPNAPEYEGLVALAAIAQDVPRSTAEKMVAGLRNAIRMNFRHPTKREQVELMKKLKPSAESLAEVAARLTTPIFKPDDKS